MNKCAQNRMGGDGLDRLNDEQFDIFLDHVLSCRECDEMLMKYEKNFIPVLKEALSEEISIPIQVLIAANGQLWSSTLKESLMKLTRIEVAELFNFKKLFSYLSSPWETLVGVIRAPATSLVFSLTAFAGVVVLGGKSLADNYLEPLTQEELQLMREVVNLEFDIPFVKNSKIDLEETGGVSFHENLASPEFLEGKGYESDGHVSVVVDGMEVSGDDAVKTDIDHMKTNSDPVPKSLDTPKPQPMKSESVQTEEPGKGRIQIRILAKPGDEIFCTRRKIFGKDNTNYSQKVIEGECSWVGLPLNEMYDIIVENRVTGHNRTFRAVASSDTTYVNEINMIEKP